MKLGLIVAADEAEGIARDGAMPWHLPEDLKRFRSLTVGQGNNAVLMGSTTWFSLPSRVRPLPDRHNLVLSRQPRPLEGAQVVSSFQEAFSEAAAYEWLWIIGGAVIYQQALALPQLTHLELTRVHGDFACDLRWPGLPHDFVLHARTPHPHFTFETWLRAPLPTES